MVRYIRTWDCHWLCQCPALAPGQPCARMSLQYLALHVRHAKCYCARHAHLFSIADYHTVLYCAVLAIMQLKA